MKRPTGQNRRGFLLLIVLVVVMVLSLGAYAFSELMLSHRMATQQSGDQLQARLVLDSGVEAMRMFLAQDKQTQRDSGGVFSNPTLNQGVLVSYDVSDPNNARAAGRYTIISPAVDADGYLAGIRYGLENESGRLNLNALLIAEQNAPGSGRQLLMALPGCTEDVADAILDFIDADDEPREFGAESDYYIQQSPAYAAKNGALDTVEELLLVRGITPLLLFGMDSNRNGILDPHEQNAPAASGAVTNPLSSLSADADMTRGWAPYLTLYSMERNVNAAGQPRVFLNMADMEKLHAQLTAVFPDHADWVTFIVAYKQYGPFQAQQAGAQGGGAQGGGQGGGTQGGGTQGGGNPGGGGTIRDTNDQSNNDAAALETMLVVQDQGGGGGSSRGGSFTLQLGAGGGLTFQLAPATPQVIGQRDVVLKDMDLTLPGGTILAQVLDMIGQAVRVPGPMAADGTPGEPITIASPFSTNPAEMAVYLPQLMDNVSVSQNAIIPGRVNINQAPRAILAGIPGMTEEILTEILSRRQVEPTDDLYRTETWLLAEGIVTLDQMKLLTPFMTAGGDVYRAQVIGYFDAGNAASRAEVIWDAATDANPRILFWRDLSHLGRGFDLSTLGVGTAGF